MRIVPDAEGVVKRHGRFARTAMISEEDLRSVQALWATVDPAYDKFLDRYNAYVRKMKRAKKPILPMRDWRPLSGRRLNELEQHWTQMPAVVEVSSCCLIALSVLCFVQYFVILLNI